MSERRPVDIDFDIRPFRPCQSVNEALGVTEYIYEDVSCYSVPVARGVYHCVDWLLASDDSRLIGIQFWSTHDPLPPTKDQDNG